MLTLFKSLMMRAILISLIAFMTTTLYAGNRANSVSFSLAAGYDYFASKREMDNTGVPFAILGYNFTNNWGIEALLGFFKTYYKNSVHDNRQIDGTLFSVDGIYRFSPYKIIEPYLLAGVGVIGLNPNRNDAHNEGNVNFGIGSEFFIEKSIAFRIEARDFYTIVGGKNDIMLDAGITFLLDLC